MSPFVQQSTYLHQILLIKASNEIIYRPGLSRKMPIRKLCSVLSKLGKEQISGNSTSGMANVVYNLLFQIMP